MASPAKRTTRPQDLKFVADPNNAQSYDEMKQAASTVESQYRETTSMTAIAHQPRSPVKWVKS